MSISSHLTPEPERRLWIIHDAMRRDVEWAEVKLAAVAAFALAEGALARWISGPLAGQASAAAAAAGMLSATVVFALFGLLPLKRSPKWLPALEPEKERPSAGENMLESSALAKHTFVEAVGRLDRYLGGGITATQYHEDLVARIVLEARAAVRKQRVFRVAWWALIAGQALLALSAWP